MEQTLNQDLLDFIAASPTAWHAVENLSRALGDAGFRELREYEDWQLRPGDRAFVRRNGSALIAFRIPAKPFPGFMLMAAHADSPGFKLKELRTVTSAGLYAQLNVERYGGMLMAPWLDRPLSAAGRVLVREGETLVTRLVDLKRDLFLIPNVAIHMDRGANENKSYDMKTDMLPLAGSAESGKRLAALVAESVGAAEADIVSTDLQLYPRTPGTVWGLEEEYLSSPRLDDLQCVFGCARGFLRAKESESASVLCVFDNEEVGSGTKQGADSEFLADTLLRLCAGLGLDEAAYRRLLAQSFMVSADNAHAVHPNHPEYADKSDRPEMNKGIVVKFNANQRYTTDAVSAAVFEEICRRAGVPTQRFTNRADLAGGSTLGNISSSHVSIDTVDIGLAQLAMHSCYETAGAKDTAWLVRAAERFFASSLRRGENGIQIRDGGVST